MSIFLVINSLKTPTRASCVYVFDRGRCSSNSLRSGNKFDDVTMKRTLNFFVDFYIFIFSSLSCAYIREWHDSLMWKIRKSIDIIRRKSKEEKNVFELLASIRRDSACSERETKMADEADQVSLFLSVFLMSSTTELLTNTCFVFPCQI